MISLRKHFDVKKLYIGAVIVLLAIFIILGVSGYYTLPMKSINLIRNYQPMIIMNLFVISEVLLLHLTDLTVGEAMAHIMLNITC